MWVQTGPELFISVDAYKKLILGLLIDPWAFSYGVRWNWAQSLPWKMFLLLSYHSKPDRAKKKEKAGYIWDKWQVSILFENSIFLQFIKTIDLLLQTWRLPCAPLVHSFVWQTFAGTHLILTGLCGIEAENSYSHRYVAPIYSLTMFSTWILWGYICIYVNIWLFNKYAYWYVVKEHI